MAKGGGSVAYDKIILGAGLYGLYAAYISAKKGENVLVLEKDGAPFQRATTINQARVHMGYHYPRSLSTAIRSAGYFERFLQDFPACVVRNFEQVYATSTNFSWTNAQEFRSFCKAAGIRCDDVSPEKYFKDELCDGAYLTTEYAYDAQVLLEELRKKMDGFSNVEILFNSAAVSIQQKDTVYEVTTAQEEKYRAPYLLNATYASVNEVMNMLGYAPFNIKYELCEIILCKISPVFENLGITVMDGPFFSIMPFGFTGYHSLTSVTFTPHKTSYSALPTFECQSKSEGTCCPEYLGNCDTCPAKPKSAWPRMSQLARKYLKNEFAFEYEKSLFSMKPILKASEIDDSRPTLVKVLHQNPTFVSVLSGKINTVYDLEEVL